MKKAILKTFFFLFFCILTLTGCKKSEEKDKILIGISCDNPPFEFYKGGKMTGFDVEFAEMLGKKLKREVEFIDMPFDSIIASLQSKKIDMAVSALSPTKERLKSVDFSKLYHSFPAILITPGLSNIKNLESLKGKTIGVQIGTTFEHYAKNILPEHVKVELRILGKVTDLIQELRTDYIDGLIIGVGEGHAILNVNPSFHVMRLPKSEETGSCAVALPKGSPLTKDVDDAINNLEADGTLHKLKEKWNVADEEHASI